MTKPWKWIGNDLDEQCSGMWIRPVPEYGYADVVRVIPCSDAGGHDNHFWVECLTAYGMDDTNKRRNVEASVGWEPTNEYQWAEAFVRYGYYDPANCYPNDHIEAVQLGPKPDEYSGPGFGPIEITVQLRSNASIKRYARKLARERM